MIPSVLWNGLSGVSFSHSVDTAYADFNLELIQIVGTLLSNHLLFATGSLYLPPEVKVIKSFRSLGEKDFREFCGKN